MHSAIITVFLAALAAGSPIKKDAASIVERSAQLGGGSSPSFPLPSPGIPSIGGGSGSSPLGGGSIPGLGGSGSGSGSGSSGTSPLSGGGIPGLGGSGSGSSGSSPLSGGGIPGLGGSGSGSSGSSPLSGGGIPGLGGSGSSGSSPLSGGGIPGLGGSGSEGGSIPGLGSGSSGSSPLGGGSLPIPTPGAGGLGGLGGSGSGSSPLSGGGLGGGLGSGSSPLGGGSLPIPTPSAGGLGGGLGGLGGGLGGSGGSFPGLGGSGEGSSGSSPLGGGGLGGGLGGLGSGSGGLGGLGGTGGEAGAGSSGLGGLLGGGLRKVKRTLAARQAAGGSTASDVQNKKCAPVTLIFARGTTEPGNVGIEVGPPLIKQLQSTYGANNVAAQGVNYPASWAGNVPGGDTQGKSSMTSLANQAIQQCPNTQLVLSGYSQGGIVTHDTMKQLPQATAAKVGAVVTFGDPDSRQAVANIAASKVKIFCAAGDGVCQDTAAISAAHLSYGSTDIQPAVQFIQSQIKA